MQQLGELLRRPGPGGWCARSGVAWNFDFMPCPGLYNKENFCAGQDPAGEMISKISGQQTQRREGMYNKVNIELFDGDKRDLF